MMPDLSANLTDSQRLNLNVISLNTRVNDQQIKIDEHDKLLVRGNGHPSLQERVRDIEGFIKEVRYWMKFIVGIGVAGLLGNVIAITVWVIKQMP
jgi:hypothetical protein